MRTILMKPHVSVQFRCRIGSVLSPAPNFESVSSKIETKGNIDCTVDGDVLYTFRAPGCKDCSERNDGSINGYFNVYL